MEILNIITRKLRYNRYAENTIATYVSYIKEFLIYENIKDPYQVSLKQIELYLENRAYSSASVQNQIIGSLKVFSKYILKRSDLALSKIKRVKKETRLQPVIPRPFLLEKLSKVKNIKHKTIITLGYGCALRVSEIIALKWEHIDRSQRIINIYNSKGNKDRIVPISENMIELLKMYFREYKYKPFVFSGQDCRQQYSAASCNAVVKNIFGNKYRFHSLRKSSATHRYDLGDDLSKIQDLLGHSSEKTTRIYVETSAVSINKLTPLI